MYKIGMIGTRDAVLGFLALGFSVQEVRDAEEAADRLRAMVKSEEYAAIYLTEDLAAALAELCDQYKDLPLPAILSIPGPGGSTGYGTGAMRRAVERAVGADIFADQKDD